MTDCIFCKIANKEIPATIVYEDDYVIGFLDINPTNIGHSLVIPRKHFPNIYETEDDILGKLIVSGKKIARALKNALGADGVNIITNNDKDAGQIIFHTHFHIIPRFKEDGFKHWKAKAKYKDGELEQTAEKIKSALK